MEIICETKKLTKKFKDHSVLDSLDMHIERGSIYGLIGKNGAGKTTLIRLLCGLQKQDGGNYTLFGTWDYDPNIINSRKRMAAIVESPAFYDDCSAKENLIEQSLIVGLPSFEESEELLSLTGLTDTGKRKARNFSLGMKQRLAIAISLVSHPDFLILDEPTNGLDPQGIIEMRELILKLNRERGMTILISSHYLDELSKIATHYGFLNEGRIVKEISFEELDGIMRKKIRIKVSDALSCVRVLEEEGIKYEAGKGNEFILYGNFKISDVILKLSFQHCNVEEIEETKESLESYYISLLGGERK